MDCLVWEGLGNRFNAIASALVVSKQVDLYWSVNKHLPMMFEEVFKPVDGLRVKNINAKMFEYSQTVDRICHYYVCNPSGLDISDFSKAILKNYRLLFDSMLDSHGAEMVFPRASVGIHYRSFLEQSKPFPEFLQRCKQWIDQKPFKPDAVFVSSDNSEYSRQLHSSIPNARMLAQDTGMKNDFDRVGSFDIWLKSLAIFRQCYGGIYSSCIRSTAFDVMRGYGIVTDFDESEKHDRHLSLENQIRKETIAICLDH